MSDTHEVISAFLDDEPFEPQALATALSDPAGRALLIDLIGLRRVVQPADVVPPMTLARPPRRVLWRTVAAAAALCLALGGGYLLGERRTAATEVAAPPATRVVQAVPFVPDGEVR